MKRILFAILALLIAATGAFGQSQGVPYFPQILPASSVVGRLANSAGPTEAIPFPILLGAITNNPVYPWNDTSTVVGQANKFFNPTYFGNPATGVNHRFNRISVGVAALSSSDIPESSPGPNWVETSLGTSFSIGQISTISAIGGAGIVGAARSSDFVTWDGLGNHSGGSVGGQFFGYNDDYTPGITTVPIALAANLVGVKGAGYASVVTFTIQSPCIINWPNNKIQNGFQLVFSGGTPPTGIVLGTVYYVIAAGLTSNQFEISAAPQGAALNCSGSASGTTTASVFNSGITLATQIDINNGGPTVDTNPFGILSSGTTVGALITAGAYGSLATNNVTAGVAIGGGATAKFRKGILFFSQALDPAAATFGTGVAMEMVSGSEIHFRDVSTNISYLIGNALTGLQFYPASQGTNFSLDGYVNQNYGGASAGNQAFSPRLRWTGNGWATTPAASRPVDWITENQPVQGATNPSTNLVTSYQINNGGFVPAFALYSPATGGLNASIGPVTTPLAAAGYSFLTLNNTSGSGLSIQVNATEVGRLIVTSNIFSITNQAAAGALQFTTAGGGQLYMWNSGGICICTSSNADPGLNNLNVAGFVEGTDLYSNDASFLVRAKTTLANGAAANTATLTNAPAAGNPTKWISIDDNGTTRKIPAW